MEEQERLNNTIGTKEKIKLEAKPVKIEEVTIKTIEKAKSDKVVCMAKHPDSEDLIRISEVKFEKSGGLTFAGLWYKEDSDKLIVKNSALAVLMRFLRVEKIIELIGKEVMTTEDERGYLAFKAY